MRVGHDFVVDAPAIAMIATGWVRASVLNEFLGRPKTTFSSRTISVPFTANISGPSVLLNAGIDLTIAPDISLYGSAGYTRTFDGAGQSANLKLGLKGTF